jgi:hypothetical protein
LGGPENPEGWKVGKYLVEPIYREEGLTLQQRRKRRRRVAEHRRERFHGSDLSRSPDYERAALIWCVEHQHFPGSI